MPVATGFEGLSVTAALDRAVEALIAAGRPSPRLDARLLLQHVLAVDHAGLLAQESLPLSADRARAYGDLLARRLAGESVARITGIRDFWSLSLALSPDTLEPRPDTETLVEAALEVVTAQGLRDRPLRLVDLGTGTGAVALALLAELPEARAVATDIAEGALRTARDNADRAGLGARFMPLCCDWMAALAGPFDLVVSNPPYIRSADMAGLDIEVSAHDPARALDGGADGCDAYRAIFAAVAARRPAPLILVEIGAGMASDVTDAAAGAGLVPCGQWADLSGTARVLGFERHAPG